MAHASPVATPAGLTSAEQPGDDGEPGAEQPAPRQFAAFWRVANLIDAVVSRLLGACILLLVASRVYRVVMEDARYVMDVASGESTHPPPPPPPQLDFASWVLMAMNTLGVLFALKRLAPPLCAMAREINEQGFEEWRGRCVEWWKAQLRAHMPAPNAEEQARLERILFGPHQQ